MEKVMIIEDDYMVRLLYEEELTDDGYEVISSEEGDGVLEMIASRRPDLILLNIKPHGRDGLSLLQKIKTNYSAMPVILCAAYEKSFRDSRSGAADGFVVKSSDLDILKKEISKAIRLRGRHTEKSGTLLSSAETETGLDGEMVRLSSPL